jgi:hypothetical protein
MDIELFEFESHQENSADSGKLLPAILVSLLFHGVLAVIFFNGQTGWQVGRQLGRQVGEQPPAKPKALSVRIFVQNPQKRQVPEAELLFDEEAIPKLAVAEDTSSAELLAQASSLARELDIDKKPPNNDLAESQPVEADVSADGTAISVLPSNGSSDVSLPPVLMIQESLQYLDAQRRTRFYSHRCNRLEKEAGIRDCESPRQRELLAANYQHSERISTYRALNPIRQLSRAERSLNVVSTQSEALAGRLSDLSIPEWFSDYIFEELEAGITHNANPGNRAVDHMLNFTDKSAAGAIARDLLSDPWVEKKTKQRLQKKVHLRN